MEARVAVPGFVDDHLDARGVRRLDDGLELVAQAVVGARGEDQHARIRMLRDGGQHRGARHRAEQAVLAVDRRVEVDRLRARQDHAVVDRLVAVAVEQHLVARGQQRLEDHLVGGGRAVGGEVGLPGAEGLRGQALRLHDDAGGVQQRIEHLHRHREVGAQQVLAGEIVEVTHPRAALERVAAGVAGRVPAVLGHAHVGLELVVERRGRLLGDLGSEDAGPAVVVALAAVEVAVHHVAGQALQQQLVLVVLERHVKRQLGTQRDDLPGHRGDVLVAARGVVAVVEQDDLHVPVGLHGSDRGGRVGGGHGQQLERVVERLRGRVHARHHLVAPARIGADHQDMAQGLGRLVLGHL